MVKTGSESKKNWDPTYVLKELSNIVRYLQRLKK